MVNDILNLQYFTTEENLLRPCLPVGLSLLLVDFKPVISHLPAKKLISSSSRNGTEGRLTSMSSSLPVAETMQSELRIQGEVQHTGHTLPFSPIRQTLGVVLEYAWINKMASKSLTKCADQTASHQAIQNWTSSLMSHATLLYPVLSKVITSLTQTGPKWALGYFNIDIWTFLLHVNAALVDSIFIFSLRARWTGWPNKMARK